MLGTLLVFGSDFWGHDIWHPLWGAGYQFWSGIGSDLAYVGVFVFAWHHLNCPEPGCWRIGKPGHEHRCRKHARR